MSDIADVIAENVDNEVITVEQLKDILNTLKIYTETVDAILAAFEGRISALED